MKSHDIKIENKKVLQLMSLNVFIIEILWEFRIISLHCTLANLIKNLIYFSQKLQTLHWKKKSKGLFKFWWTYCELNCTLCVRYISFSYSLYSLGKSSGIRVWRCLRSCRICCAHVLLTLIIFKEKKLFLYTLCHI